MILVVDDHVDTCHALARLITAVGYESTCVESGEKALEFLREQLPKLVILDVMMPGMDGIEVLRRIRQNPKTAAVPVVFCSSIAPPDYLAFAKSLGATDFWLKSALGLENLKEFLKPYVDQVR